QRTLSVAVQQDDGPVTVFQRLLRVRPEAQARFLRAKPHLIQVSASIAQPSRDSAAHLSQTVEALLTENDPDTRWLNRQLERTEQIGQALSAGRDPYTTLRGVVRRAYRSPLDGTLQPYVVWIPPSYDRTVARGDVVPMVMVFHGMGSAPEHALQALVGRTVARTKANARWTGRFPDQGAILVAPLGYVGAGHHPMGCIAEHDLMQVMDQMTAAYHIDRRRVSLTGYSLGGTVAFVAPLHTPDRFSAAAPLCGYPDPGRVRPIDPQTLTHPWEKVLYRKAHIGNYAEQGRFLPMHIVHGGRDSPERSEAMVHRYRSLGYRVRYDLQEELGHNVWSHAYDKGRMVTWLQQHRQPEPPTQVHLKTADYRYAQAWWVRLIASRDYAQFATIQAHFDRTQTALTVTTDNVHSFALELSALPTPALQLKATIDGTALQLDRTAAVVYLVRDPSAQRGWHATTTAPDRRGHKRYGVAGPLSDALLHRQLIVYGTQDPAQTEANRLTAQWFSHGDRPRWAIRYPIKADIDVTEVDIRQHTLVLIGNPKSNALTRRLLPHLPVQFSDDTLTLSNGRQFSGEGVGISLIHPHPDNPDEYLVLHAGVDRQGTLASRHLPWLVPDYLVYDQGLTRQRRGTLLGARRVRAGGFFNQAWGWDP
ncbi:MAG: prolyl oligopeptidase family serine peptidase, partial [Myxococcota bacterium]